MNMTEFINKKYCSDLKTDVNDFALKNRKAVLNEIENFKNGSKTFWSDLVDKEYKLFEYKETFFEDFSLSSAVDILTNDSLFMIKGGNPKPWHEYQISLLNSLFDRDHGYLIYLKDEEVQVVEGKESQIIETYNQDLKIEKNPKCKYCIQKNDCHEWVGESTVLIDEFIDLKRKKVEIEEKMNVIKEDLIDLDPKRYRSELGELLISERKDIILPKNYESIRPPGKYPGLYTLKPNKAMKDEIGETRTTKILKVTL